MPSDLAEILLDLPVRHRNHLLASFAGETKGLRNNEERLEKIAAVLGVEGVAPYRALYLEPHGHRVTWYVGRELDLDRIAVFDQFTDRFENAEYGIEQTVVANAPPVFHQVTQNIHGGVSATYVSDGGTRDVRDGWSTVTVQVFAFDRVTFQAAPFTVALRGVPGTRRPQLIEAISKDLGVARENLVECNLAEPSAQKQLAGSLQAREIGVKGKGRGKGLGPWMTFTDGLIALGEQEDWLKICNDLHRETLARYWTFETTHHEGYVETASYSVRLGNGDLSIAGGISETALERLRQHVVVLF